MSDSLPRAGVGQRKPAVPAHERLKAWHACHALALAVYRSTATWPRTEVYGLTTQARRAALSAAANLAEGAAKRGAKEFRRYLDISHGSLAELGYILLLAKDLGYMSQREYGELEALRDHAGQLTWGLCRAIGRAAGKAPGR